MFALLFPLWEGSCKLAPSWPRKEKEEKKGRPPLFPFSTEKQLQLQQGAARRWPVHNIVHPSIQPLWSSPPLHSLTFRAPAALPSIASPQPQIPSPPRRCQLNRQVAGQLDNSIAGNSCQGVYQLCTSYPTTIRLFRLSNGAPGPDRPGTWDLADLTRPGVCTAQPL